jgi:CheY-like chemotaxis protein
MKSAPLIIERPLRLLLADDDPDDLLLAREALEELGRPAALNTVPNGEQLLDYLHRRGAFAAPGMAPPPSLVMLDLNMPRIDGRALLRMIRADATLCHLPVIVMTTSRAPEHVRECYQLGASSFITKPIRFDDMVETMRMVCSYRGSIVELPRAE